MKPNLIVVEPPECPADARIESVCELLSEWYYVYLVRPGSGFRDDSPGGVRFLNHSLDRLPGFADVAIAVAIREAAVAERLKAAYPQSRLAIWHPDRELPQILEARLRLRGLDSRVVAGDFRPRPAPELARAM